jgi:glycosyltransferase involved in cell wall biosynthesis
MSNYKRLEGGLKVRGLFNRESTPDRPLVSIITVCYNSEKYLEQTIQSVINQTYDNIEYIIIDGASTDGTLNIIRKYDDYIAYWMSEPDKNMYDAINKGLDLISGEYWAVLNSDDYYFPDTIKNVVDFFSKNPELDVVNGATKMVDIENKYLHTKYPPKFNVKSMIRMKINGIIDHPSTFLRKEVVNRIGKFNINYPIISDYDFLIRVGLNCKVKSCNDIFTNFRVHSECLSMHNKEIESEKNREEIVTYYSNKYNVNMNLVWWDYLRLYLKNLRIENSKAILRKIFRIVCLIKI